MKNFIKFLKTDIKIINSYFLFAIILIILVCIGYSSYALFSFTKTSNNVIEGTVGELKKSGVDTLIKLTDNKDSSGLYTITHPADNTLQIKDANGTSLIEAKVGQSTNLVQTGTSYVPYIVVSGIALIAVAVLVAKKVTSK